MQEYEKFPLDHSRRFSLEGTQVFELFPLATEYRLFYLVFFIYHTLA